MMKPSKTCLMQVVHPSLLIDNNIEKLKETMHENHRVDIREIAVNFNNSCVSTQHILVNVLHIKRGNDRLVLKYPNLLQKCGRVEKKCLTT